MKNIQEKVTEAVKGRQRVSVSEFIDAYWPLSPETKKLQEISLEKDTSFDEWKNSVHAQEVMYFDEMRERFGNEKIDEYLRRAEKVQACGFPEAYHKLNDYVFKEGIGEYIPPSVLFRSRALLQLLLENLVLEQSFSLVDIGAGNGKITAGLLAYLPNINEVYMLDANSYALARAKENIAKASKLVRRDLASRVQIVQGDWRDTTHIETINRHIKDERTILLSAFADVYGTLEEHLDAYFPLSECETRAFISCREMLNGLPSP